MAMVLKNGAVFLHIPKTGGTWVAQTLTEMGLKRCSIGSKHANWPHILAGGSRKPTPDLEYRVKRALYLELNPRPFTFCFVRHPVAWYESFFTYKSQPGIDWQPDGDENDVRTWHPNSALNGLGKGKDFHQFVEAVLEKFPGYVTSLYAHFTFRPVDFVGRQENLRDDLATVLHEMSLPFDVDLLQNQPRVNQSVVSRDKPVWDPDLRARVLEAEYAGLKRFGYA